MHFAKLWMSDYQSQWVTDMARSREASTSKKPPVCHSYQTKYLQIKKNISCIFVAKFINLSDKILATVY